MALVRPALGLATLLLVAAVVAACGGRAAITHLPVVGCKTEDAVGAGVPVIPGYLPTTADVPAGLASSAANGLAWYEGDVKKQAGLKVLAPRGWRCSALLGADGGWSLAVQGPKAKQTVQIGASYNGPGASTACNYFPSAYRSSPIPTFCKAPHGATITLKSDHLATVESTLTGAGIRLTELSFLYWYPQLGNAAEGVNCTLPATEKQMCAAILAEAESRIGQQLQSYAKKYGSTTAAAPSASQQMTATVTGAKGVCLPEVSSSAPTAADSFALRRPGNGLTEGNVVAVPTSVQNVGNGCSIALTFNVGTKLGFYVVFDETDGLSWGPFDSRNLPAAGWALNLTYNGS